MKTLIDEICAAITHEPKFMVFVQGTSHPAKMHDTFHSAQTEAERLAQQPGNAKRKIHVVHVLASLVPQEHEWE